MQVPDPSRDAVDPDPTWDRWLPEPEASETAAPVETPRPPVSSVFTRSQKRKLRRHAIIAVISFSLCFVGGKVVNTVFGTPEPVDISAQQAPIAPQAQPVPPTITKIRAAFGPWRLVESGKQVSHRVLLISQNGTLEAGTAELYADESWKPSVAIEIDTLVSANDTVTFRIAGQHVITVAPGQVFVFVDEPDMAYLVTPEGTVQGKSTAELMKGK